MVATNNMLFDYYSHAVYERILKHLELKDEVPVFTAHYSEFDDCSYVLQNTADGKLQLAMSLPVIGAPFQSSKLSEELRQIITQTYRNVATLIPPPEGYMIALELDMKMLRRMGKNDREYWVKQICSIRLMVAGNPMRALFHRLAVGASTSGPVEAHCNRPGQVYFVKPNKDSVTVIFPMRFVTSQDAAIGTAFLQEFVEARRTAALKMSPSCSYLTTKNPPMELQGVPASMIGDANGGFMCFTFFQRHVAGPQLESVLWSMVTFYYLIGYHIKASKAMMHTRMRAKVSAMLTTLEQGMQIEDPGVALEADVGLAVDTSRQAMYNRQAGQLGNAAKAALPRAVRDISRNRDVPAS